MQFFFNTNAQVSLHTVPQLFAHSVRATPVVLEGDKDEETGLPYAQTLTHVSPQFCWHFPGLELFSMASVTSFKAGLKVVQTKLHSGIQAGSHTGLGDEVMELPMAIVAVVGAGEGIN